MNQENLINSLLDDLLNDSTNEISQEVIQERKALILSDMTRLKQIRKELKDTKLLMKKSITKSSQLYSILGGSQSRGLSLIVNKQNDYSKISRLILEAYHLTTNILSNVGLISKVNYVITYQTDKDFYRLTDIPIDENAMTYEIRGEDKGKTRLVLRMNESYIRSKVNEKKNNNDINWVSAHYKEFIQPFKDAEKRSSKRRKYKFKMNAGVAAEAFERHWENLHHQLDKPSINYNLAVQNPIGYAWVLYKQSSRNAPYYTGPDTLYSQVKNSNASIISNVDTVLNTMEAVIQMGEENISGNELNKIKEQYKKAFKAKEGKLKIPKKIMMNVDKEAKEQINNVLKDFKIKNN